MHIMHVIDSLAVGGAERMLVDLANQTAADGHRASVCVTRSECALASELRPDVALEVLNRKVRLDVPALRAFGRLVRDRRVDLLHVHGRSSFSLVALMKTLGLVPAPVLLHDHFGAIEIDASVPPWFRLWGRHLLTHYVGVYDKLGRWAVAAGVPERKVSVIGNALNLERFRPGRSAKLREELGLGDEVPLGITVSGQRYEKGTDVLLEALARRTGGGRVRVVVVGGARDAAYAAHCRELCASLGLEDTVLFLGERSDVPDLLQEADFAVMPSRSESGPLVLVEYMAVGLPFVSTRVGDITEHVAQRQVPEFVPPDDPPALAGALDRLLALAPSQRRARGEAGRAVALQLFDIRAVMPRWYEVYGKALGRRGGLSAAAPARADQDLLYRKTGGVH